MKKILLLLLLIPFVTGANYNLIKGDGEFIRGRLLSIYDVTSSEGCLIDVSGEAVWLRNGDGYYYGDFYVIVRDADFRTRSCKIFIETSEVQSPYMHYDYRYRDPVYYPQTDSYRHLQRFPDRIIDYRYDYEMHDYWDPWYNPRYFPERRSLYDRYYDRWIDYYEPFFIRMYPAVAYPR
jgi:hypothetical protein